MVVAGLESLGPARVLLPTLALGVPPPDRPSSYGLPPPYAQVARAYRIRQSISKYRVRSFGLPPP